MGVRIEIKPVEVKRDGNGGKVVTGGTLKLTNKGSGPPPPEESEAQIQFWEIVDSKDATKEPRLLGTVKGTLKMTDNPVFDLGAVKIEHNKDLFGEIGDQNTDFFVKIGFDKETFTNVGLPFSLLLPWEVDEENQKIEVGTVLVVGGNEHAGIKINDTLDIPLKQPDVPEDGTGKTKLTCFGASVVYPKGNKLLRPSDRVPFDGKTMQIFLHETVRTAFDKVRSDSFDLDKLKGLMKESLKTGGFDKVDIQEKTTAEAGVWWNLASTGTVSQFVAKNISDPSGAFPNNFAPTDGMDLPFFEYWVFHNANIRGDLHGQSEGLTTPNGIDFKKQTKRVLTPIVLAGGGQFDTILSEWAPTDPHIFVANVILHEVGHSLGLHHPLQFDDSKKTYTVDNTGLGIMTQQGLKRRLKRFSPIEKAALKTHFL